MSKDLNYWKKNAEEDYIKTPISVLKYIAELEIIVGKNNELFDCEECGSDKCVTSKFNGIDKWNQLCVVCGYQESYP